MARAKTYADRVNIIKMIKIDGRWPFAPVVERNGRIIRDHVLVNGKDEHHPEGRYYLEWYEGGKKRRQPIGMFEEALPAARTKIPGAAGTQGRHSSSSPGFQIAPRLAASERKSDKPQNGTEPTGDRLTMVAAVDQFLEFCEKQRSLRNFRTYRPALKTYFLNSYAKIYLDEITREDILRYVSDCFDRGLAARSVSDKLITVLTILKRHGYKKLIERSEWQEASRVLITHTTIGV